MLHKEICAGITVIWKLGKTFCSRPDLVRIFLMSKEVLLWMNIKKDIRMHNI